MTGESRSMEQNVLERSGLMKDFLSEKINGLKRERLKEIREKFESNVGNVRKQFESVLGAITSEAEQEIIVISYLRASYITETHEFYVGVYKGEPFVEEIKHGFISVKPLLEYFQKFDIVLAVVGLANQWDGAHPEEGLPKLWQLPVFQASHHRKAHGQILCLLPME